MGRMTWTSEMMVRLVELVSRGYSSGQIARELGGMTRNAVIGKAGRMKKKLTHEKDKPPEVLAAIRRHRVEACAQTPRAPRERPEPAPVLVRPTGAPIGILALTEGSCRWPVNDGGPFLFCGADKAYMRPYCPWHEAKSFRRSECP